MPSCAGAYISGAAGSNACPAGSVRIATEAACRTAVAAAGKTPSTSTSSPFVGTFSSFPRGCYFWTTSNNAYFNTHAVGAGCFNAQLLCAAVTTTGAPLTHRASVRARVDWAVLAGGVRNNATNGLNIDTHTNTNRYLYTYICTRMMPTALVGGAARRTAAQADGGRACTGT